MGTAGFSLGKRKMQKRLKQKKERKRYLPHGGKGFFVTKQCEKGIYKIHHLWVKNDLEL